MSDIQPTRDDAPKTWLIDGKPGQILALLAAAALEAGIVELKENEHVGDHYDIGAVERAARAWPTAGIVVIPRVYSEFIGTPYEVSGKYGKKWYTAAVVHYDLTVVAPDGSYVVATGVGAGASDSGKFLANARTDARKECLRCLLSLASTESSHTLAAKRIAERKEAEEAERAARELRGAWSEDLRAVVAAIDAAESPDELKALGKHQAQARLSVEEREQARAEWKRRQNDLFDLDARTAGARMRGGKR